MKKRGPYIPLESYALQLAYIQKPIPEPPMIAQWRVDRLLELHRQANELATREPALEREFAAALKEFAYVYKRANVAEQGEYHHRLAEEVPPSALTTYLTIQHKANKFVGTRLCKPTL